jgi:3'-phosphoadenosine 5'-phosphosulfate sulfotransferase (PAPS reductase)/FAD synthetase
MLLKSGFFCDPSYKYKQLPDIKQRDMYDIIRGDTGADFIITGAKLADSAWRRRYFNLTKDWTDVIHPIKDWNKLDVLGYLRTRGIPEPPSSGKNATGIGVDETSVLWLSDNYPDDFKKLCEVFPYAEARVYRRLFYPENT